MPFYGAKPIVILISAGGFGMGESRESLPPFRQLRHPARIVPCAARMKN